MVEFGHIVTVQVSMGHLLKDGEILRQNTICLDLMFKMPQYLRQLE